MARSEEPDAVSTTQASESPSRYPRTRLVSFLRTFLWLPGIGVVVLFLLAMLDRDFVALGNSLFPFGQPGEGIILGILVLGTVWAMYDEAKEIWLTRNVTFVELSLRRSREDEPRARKAYAVAQRRGNWRQERDALKRLGGSLFTQGRCEEAIHAYETLLSLAETMHDQTTQYMALDALETISSRRQDFDAARRFYERRLMLARAMEDRSWLVETLENYASFAQARGDLSVAESLYRENVAMTQTEGLTPFAPMALAKLGTFLVSNRGEREQGCAMMREAAALSHASGDRMEEEDIRDMMREVGCE